MNDLPALLMGGFLAAGLIYAAHGGRLGPTRIRPRRRLRPEAYDVTPALRRRR